jgi:hypothetical protein
MPMEKYTLADLNGTKYSNIQGYILTITSFLRLRILSLFFTLKHITTTRLFTAGLTVRDLLPAKR